MSRCAVAAAVRRTAGIVLAAGASRRMGSPKAALVLAEESFVARVLGSLAAGGVEPLVVVVGKDGDAVRAALPPDRRVVVLENRDAGRGQLSSLKVALTRLAAMQPPVDAAVVALVDHPAVRSSTVATLREALRDDGAAIAIPLHGGRRGHPVAFARAVWPELLATPDDLGARAVTRRDPARVRVVEVDDPGVLADIDTPEDLSRLGGHFPRRA